MWKRLEKKRCCLEYVFWLYGKILCYASFYVLVVVVVVAVVVVVVSWRGRGDNGSDSFTEPQNVLRNLPQSR